MKSTLTRIRKILRTYKRYTIKYGIPIFITSQCWSLLVGFNQGVYLGRENNERQKDERIMNNIVIELQHDVSILKGDLNRYRCIQETGCVGDEDCHNACGIEMYQPIEMLMTSCTMPTVASMIYRGIWLGLGPADDYCEGMGWYLF